MWYRVVAKLYKTTTAAAKLYSIDLQCFPQVNFKQGALMNINELMNIN